MPKKYKDSDDSELYYLVSEGNEEANKLFFEKYDNIIKMKAAKYKVFAESKGIDFNDLLQEGRLGLTNAINNYKEQKNVHFFTFANLCIDRQISSFLRNMSRDKHEILNNSISLDTTMTSIGKPIIDLILDDKNINPEISFISMEEQNELLEKVDKLLTKSERDVFDLRMQGFSYKEIEQLLNMSKKSVDGTMSRVRSKLSNIFDK